MAKIYTLIGKTNHYTTISLIPKVLFILSLFPLTIPVIMSKSMLCEMCGDILMSLQQSSILSISIIYDDVIEFVVIQCTK